MNSFAVQQSFYAVAAQVIPVLFLVLLIGEGRVIRTDHPQLENWRGTALLAIFATGVMVLGEMAALRALAQGQDTYFLHGATALALVYGFTFVFAQAVKSILLGGEEQLPHERKEALGRFYLILVAVALVASWMVLYPDFLLGEAF